MTSLLAGSAIVPLLAQRGPLVEQIRLRSTTDLSSFLSALVLVLAVIGIVLLTKRCVAESERRRTSSPRALFRELCRAHQLSWSDRQLLLKLAAWHALPDPALLFIEPARFQVAAGLDDYRERLAQLQRQLFE
jgi:hypothetical protein